jgi:Ca-activated chloride channel family protein
VLVGRYKQGGAAKLTIRGSVEETKHQFHFPVELVRESHDETFAFAEKLWALRRVGEIIDEIDLQGKWWRSRPGMGS